MLVISIVTLTSRLKPGLEKYGANNIFETEQFKNDLKQHNLEKYGVEYFSQSDELKNKYIIIQNNIDTLNCWYNCDMLNIYKPSLS